MKTTTATEESDSSKSLKNDTNSNEKKPEIEEMKPSTSSDLPVSEEQQDSTDKLFEPTVDMIVNDFDDEQTLEEEEKLAEKEHLDPADELNDLEREGEMPIEELLKLYGCAPPSCSGATNAGTSSTSSRKRRRRNEKVSPNNKIPTVKNPSLDVDCGEQPPTVQPAKEESPLPDDDTNTTTTTINNLENQSMDETNYEEEEPSALNKLYPDMFGKDGNDGILKLDVSDEEDFDYSPDEDDGKKTIMVGSDYQALIPEELCKYDDALPYENEDKLLWDPSKLNDAEIEDYLQKFNSIQKFSALASSQNQTSTISTVNGKHLRDDEQALFLLVQCGGNYEEALRRRRLLGAVQPSTTQSMSIWSEDECKNFECGLRTYGKRFNEIQHSKVGDEFLNTLKDTK